MSLGVAEVAHAAGVSPHTVRYYVARGLLRARKDPRSGYHRFTRGDVRTLAFVRRAQALGFALSEVETVIAMSHRRESPCPLVRDIVRRRVRRALRRWRRMPDRVPTGDEICRLIESVGAPVRALRRHATSESRVDLRAARGPSISIGTSNGGSDEQDA